ncbi:hypothetical protein PQX77_020851 [Marasmius sp. AFHP31]|nr:hypothetical protein PQX77_020851 [Marasmius sp. AFHP31]
MPSPPPPYNTAIPTPIPRSAHPIPTRLSNKPSSHSLSIARQGTLHSAISPHCSPNQVFPMPCPRSLSPSSLSSLTDDDFIRVTQTARHTQLIERTLRLTAKEGRSDVAQSTSSASPSGPTSSSSQDEDRFERITSSAAFQKLRLRVPSERPSQRPAFNTSSSEELAKPFTNFRLTARAAALRPSGSLRSVTPDSRAIPSEPNSDSESEFSPEVQQAYVGGSLEARQVLWTEVDESWFHPSTFVGTSLRYLATLRPSTWIDINPIDLFLLSHRLQAVPNTLHCLYVPLQVHYPLPDPSQPLAEDIRRYTRILGTSAQRQASLACTVLHIEDSHWCALVADPRRNAAFILGHKTTAEINIRAESEWHHFNGPEIYEILCRAHDWPTDQPSTVISLSWQQLGGTECGVHTVEALMSVIHSGLLLNGSGIPILHPNIRCTHQTRVEILFTLHKLMIDQVVKFLRLYHDSDPRVQAQVTQYNSTEAYLRDLPLLVDSLHSVAGVDGLPTRAGSEYLDRPLQALRGAMGSCVTCSTEAHRINQAHLEDPPDIHHSPPLPGPPSAHTALDGGEYVDPETGDCLSTRRDLVARVRARHPALLRDACFSRAHLPEKHRHTPEPDSEASASRADEGARLHTNRALRLKPSNLTQATYLGRKFPVTCKPPNLVLIRSLKGLIVTPDDTFDDYEGGPTLESLEVLWDEIASYNFRPTIYYFATSPPTVNPFGPLTEWSDRGWRILRNFAQRFYLVGDKALPTPTALAAHLFPPMPDYEGFLQDEDHPDLVTVSLPRLLDEIDVDPMAALHGRLRTSPIVGPKAARLSITSTPPTRPLIKTVDLDSFICVTTSPRFTGFVSIFARPLHRNTPPLTRHNHVYIEVLVPQSEADRHRANPIRREGPSSAFRPDDPTRHTRSEFIVKTLKLSQIPHMDLAHFPNGATLRMFFPRMTHKRYLSRYYATNIDLHIKQVFYRHVIGPAIRHVKPEQDYQYDVRSEHGWEHHQGNNKTPSTIPLDPHEFHRLIKRMRELVCRAVYQDCNPIHPRPQVSASATYDLLSRFGSFFFVLEIKGTKRFTRVVIPDRDSIAECIRKARDKLQNLVGYFDFHATNRARGCEVYFDLSFNVTPANADRLAGLQRLDFLQNAFHAGGYASQQPHRLLDLDLYGGLQAEALGEHSRQSGIIFANGYNLVYEGFRNAKNTANWFSTDVLGAFGEKYQQHLASRRTLIDDMTARDCSFGVRREFRISEDALTTLATRAEVANQLDIDRFARTSVTWIPVADLARLHHARMTALDRAYTTIALRTERPRNYIQLCGLFSYLMQSITSTPVEVPTFTKDVLSQLQYGIVMSLQGMFFIGQLALDLENIVPDLERADTYDMWRQAKLRRDPQQDSYRERSNADPFRDRRIAISQVAQSLRERPWAVMKEWNPANPPRGLDIFAATLPGSPEALAKDVFWLWTVSTWSLLTADTLRTTEPPIGTLLPADSSVMQLVGFWSVEARFNALRIPEFHAIVEGEDRDAFATKAMKFFTHTPPGRVPNTWRMFREQVIPVYDQSRSHFSSVHEKQAFEVAITTLFRHCQCLPRADDRNPWKIGSQSNAVELIVNPGEYDEDSLRTDVIARRIRSTRGRIIRKQDEYWRTVTQALAPAMTSLDHRQAIRSYRWHVSRLGSVAAPRGRPRRTGTRRMTSGKSSVLVKKAISGAKPRPRGRPRGTARVAQRLAPSSPPTYDDTSSPPALSVVGESESTGDSDEDNQEESNSSDDPSAGDQ